MEEANIGVGSYGQSEVNDLLSGFLAIEKTRVREVFETLKSIVSTNPEKLGEVIVSLKKALLELGKRRGARASGCNNLAGKLRAEARI